jgi:Gas vesicle synthesis protein GvpO
VADNDHDDPPPRRRRAPRDGRAAPRARRSAPEDRRDEPEDREAPADRRNGHRPARGSAGSAARRALQELADLTGHDIEGVVSVEPTDNGWKIGIEVVEARRIPDSADILAVYEVRLDADGELAGYRRQERYARGQTYGRPR